MLLDASFCLLSRGENHELNYALRPSILQGHRISHLN